MTMQIVEKTGYAKRTLAIAIKRYYISRMQLLFGSSIIRYWPLNDAVGASTVLDFSGNIGNGTPTAVTFGQTGPKDHTAALFNGTTSLINVYSAAYNTIFNHAEGTAMLWFRITSAGVWTDGNLRVGLEIRADGSNAIHLAKNTPNNDLQCAYIAGGTSRTCDFACSNFIWHHFCLTWSQAANEWRAYLDGVLGAGLPQNIGTWVGALDANTNIIGAYNSTPILQFSGMLSDVLVLNRLATADEILQCL